MGAAWPVKWGHDLVGEQLVAGLGGRPRREVGAHHQVGAEAAGLGLEPLDLGDRHLRGADDHAAGLVEEVDEAVEVARGLRVVGVSQGQDVAEVVEHPLQAVAAVLLGLRHGLGEVQGTHQPPLGAIRLLTVALGLLVPDVEVVVEHLEPGGLGGGHRDEPGAVAAGQLGARRRHAGHQGHVEVAVGTHLEHGVVAREPVGLLGHGLTGEEPHHDVEGLLHAGPLVVGFDAEHGGVGGELAGAGAEHHAAPGEVVEHDDAVGQHERVVVGERVDPGAELDVAGALGGRGDEHLGAGDELRAGRVVLADPRLVVAEAVEQGDQVEVSLQRQRGVHARLVHGRQEDPELERRFEGLEMAHGPTIGPGGRPCSAVVRRLAGGPMVVSRGRRARRRTRFR